jgi:hypothetical protein
MASITGTRSLGRTLAIGAYADGIHTRKEYANMLTIAVATSHD